MKRLFSLLLCAILLLSVYPITVNAVAAKVDRVNIEIDVPVDGVKLPQDVKIDYFCDSQNTYFPNSKPPMKVQGLAWYRNSGTPLSDDYKAKLGETYSLTVFLEPDNGFECASELETANNKINGMSAYTMLFGDKYWAFSAEFTTIPSVSGKPVISVKKLNLTPYEGEPVEFMIDATGTNLKYQWQIGWADSSWASMVDIDDNEKYSGSKTDYFRIHTFFGDTFDESGFDVRCRVTGDNGETYSQVFNFSFIDRTVVNSINVSGLTTPISGKTPDYSATTSDSEYSVSKVEWYGPANASGIYTKMYTNQSFTSGEYFCRLYITPEREYRFDSNTVFKLDGISHKLNTIDGSKKNPCGADEYYVNVPYTVEFVPDVVNTIKANVTKPVAGALPNATVTPAGEGYETTDVDWSYYDETAGEYYIMPDGMTFEAGKTYECAVRFDALDEYTFPENKDYIAGYINGYKGVVSQVYSTKRAYVLVEFTVPDDSLKVIFTPDSKPDVGSKLTVDIERMAELDDDLMQAYFDGTVTYKWFYDGRLQTTTKNNSYEIKNTMLGHYIAVKVVYGNKSIVSEEFEITKASTTGLLGDVDGDGKVSIMDATVIQRHIAQLESIKEDRLPYADTDKDGKVSIIDATMIQRLIAQLITEF